MRISDWSSDVCSSDLVIGLATAAHQAFSANLYTLPSDIFPRGAVGSVVGIGGTVGAVGGMGMAWFTGYILDATHSYATLFAIRSEEHTSELQSLMRSSYAGFCLKKNTYTIDETT